MDTQRQARPRIARETRLLLVTVLISLAALWALARIRFPDRPASPNPVPPLLTQLAVPFAFSDLATEIARTEARVMPSLVTVPLPPPRTAVALRVADGLGATWLDVSDGSVGSGSAHETSLVAYDRVTGLALVSIPRASTTALPVSSSTPERLDRPRYLVASGVTLGNISLRPVFVGRLASTTRPWLGDIWAVPSATAVAPGDFVFTTTGDLVGLVTAQPGVTAIVPGDVLLREIDRLRAEPPRATAWLGVDVQALTPALVSATGTSTGVMIVSVDPDGPAAKALAVMDVVEAIGDQPIAGPEDWRVAWHDWSRKNQ